MLIGTTESGSNTGDRVDGCRGAQHQMAGVLAHTRRAVFVALTVVLVGCVVTRTSRPMIQGTVVDEETNRPVGGVEIWNVSEVETTSASNGTFVLSRHTYREVTFPGGEAPPLLVEFRAVKEGYCTYRYKNFSIFGGGGSDATWTVEVKLTPVRPDCDTSTTFLPPLETDKNE